MLILDRINHYLNLFLMVLAGLFLVAMIALTCANVFFACRMDSHLRNL